jgi:ROK family
LKTIPTLRSGDPRSVASSARHTLRMAGGGPPRRLNQIHYRPRWDSDFLTNFVLRQEGQFVTINSCIPRRACGCSRPGRAEQPRTRQHRHRHTGIAVAGKRPTARFQLGLSEMNSWRALAHVIKVFDPDVIVLGGGLSNPDRLCENVPRLWPRFVFSDRVHRRLTRYVQIPAAPQSDGRRRQT